jgi:tRNA pseudouridine55 synthase
MTTSGEVYDFINGEVLLFDKPYGWTSFDLVGKVRNFLCRELKVKKLKVGHAGTLDPLATGLLVVCTGKSTKKVESLQAQEKEYIATLKLGATTPSFDCETREDQWFNTDHININLFSEKLREFVGSLEQVPPSFSAVKINGKRAYKHARAGRDPELKPKTIVISHIKLLSFNMPEAIISITCSKGTYIRALARDIGIILGSGAYLTALRRTRIGDFYVDNAMTFDKFREKINSEIEHL